MDRTEKIKISDSIKELKRMGFGVQHRYNKGSCEIYEIETGKIVDTLPIAKSGAWADIEDLQRWIELKK